ncbi:hypothetical protein VTK26DRAFT_8280 [Humicola hyalothermophila]
MPGLARKVIICAAVDGLVLHPLNSSNKRESRSSAAAFFSSPVRIKYGDASISPAPRSDTAAYDLASFQQQQPDAWFEAYGIVGLITVFRHSYLVSITRRQQVALLCRAGAGAPLPVYVVTEVALTPCASRREAADAVAKTAAALRSAPPTDGDDGERERERERGPPFFPASSSSESRSRSGDRDRNGDGMDANDDDDAGGDGGGAAVVTSAGEDEGTAGGVNGGLSDDALDPVSDTEAPAEVGPRPGGSIAQEVIGQRGNYGRFAQRWFSRSGWAMGQKRMIGLGAAGVAAKDQAGLATNVDGPSDADGSEAAVSLLPKLLRTSQILFGSSRTFYFSYDYDITRSMVNPKIPETPLIPLHRHVDPTYFWNQHIIQPFIDAGIDSLALPLMQGFVGQRTFVVDSHPPQTDEGAHKDSVELHHINPSRAASPSFSDKATVGTRPTEKKFNITVISRRSIKRAGLRYLRRGIDEDGNVANSVESEQILSPADAACDPNVKVYSFVQTRGSIPLFFTQSPYSLKPVPVMQHSPDANFAALKKHFEGLRQQYGSVQVVSLVEKHGVEAPIAELYEQSIRRLNEETGDEPDKKIGFEWFDFHAVCRGMKFENVSFLLQILGSKLEEFGSSVSVDGRVVARQKGVLRTNCMDCLDRTNVCQSSFAKHMLDLQLREQGFDMSAQLDQENAWFNTLWADNGDAISKQYASTGAMKGDYTRTRKRNYRGALTDAGLSLTRLFNGMFNDFFLQASIDFLLGNVTSLVFEEFEATMMTKDPAVSMQSMRQQAIELCQKRVIADEAEDFIGGWTLLTPHVPDTVRSGSLEEAVLLLTDVALYLCRFDWNLDKVSSFERVDLAHVQKIKFGTYITSTISPAQTDGARNFGLVIEYKPGLTDVTRVNTRSLSSLSSKPTAHEPEEAAKHGASSLSADSRPASPSGPSGIVAGLLSRHPQAFSSSSSSSSSSSPSTSAPPRKIALKALHSQTSAVSRRQQQQQDELGAVTRLTEIQQVVLIASEIERLAIRNQPRLAGKGPEETGLIEKGDIISLAEAKRNTGLLEHLGHSIKKLVWA